KYAFFTGSDWVVETVDSPGPVGMYCSMALQSGTTAYVSYMDGSSFDVKLAWQSGGGWEFEKVDTLGELGFYTSIAIGSDGYPQIAYHGTDFSGVRVARWNGSSWAIETIDATAQVEGQKGIAVDSYGYAHVTYHDENQDALKHAYWNGSAWNTELVDDAGTGTGYYNSLAIDNGNNLHIAYAHAQYDDSVYLYSELKYAKRDPTTGVETELAGKRFQYRLFQNSPNPFSQWTGIRFQLAQPGAVSIKIYDIAGRQVKVLTSGKAKAGPHEVAWDGTDAAGRTLPSGVYFTQMKSGEFLSTRKVLLIR
ncbi:T9SS type A sorting domain-containing protein, partial [candidate division TA06 bacterium]